MNADKYAGHSPGPWRRMRRKYIRDCDGNHIGNMVGNATNSKQDLANTALAADALLLLAENTRLIEQRDALVEALRANLRLRERAVEIGRAYLPPDGMHPMDALSDFNELTDCQEQRDADGLTAKALATLDQPEPEAAP